MHDFKSRGTMPVDGPFALTRRHAAAGLLAAGAAGALSARPARADTKVSWMGWQGYDECYAAGTYLQDHGITMEKTYINANEEIITKLQAGGVGQVDLITMYFGYLPIMAAMGVLEPFDLSKVPNGANVIPEFLNHEAIRYEGQLYGVPWTWGSLPLMYDPAATAAPASWMDILKDEYKGKVVMIHDPLGNIMVWGRTVTGAENSTILTHAQLKETVDFLINVKKNHARAFASSYGEASDMFARGEVVVSALGWEAMVGFAAAAGKEIAFTIPQEGTAMYMDCLCIAKDAPHPEESYGLANECLSVEGQARAAEILTQGITNLDTLPKLSDANKAMYAYENISEFVKVARLYPMPPTESDGTIATYDEILEEYDRLLKA